MDIGSTLYKLNKRCFYFNIANVEGTGHWVAVLPNASKAYVENKNDRPFVTVIDLKARKVIGHIPVPNGTEGIAASPDGKRVMALDYKEPGAARDRPGDGYDRR